MTTEKMTTAERAKCGNEIYAAVYPVLSRYESRGGNAHSRAQLILEEALEKMDRWISRQRIAAVTPGGMPADEVEARLKRCEARLGEIVPPKTRSEIFEADMLRADAEALRRMLTTHGSTVTV